MVCEGGVRRCMGGEMGGCMEPSEPIVVNMEVCAWIG